MAAALTATSTAINQARHELHNVEEAPQQLLYARVMPMWNPFFGPGGFGSRTIRSVVAAYEWVQRNLIWFLLASFILAALLPGPGLIIRAVSVSTTLLPGAQWRLTLPMLLLGVLLFNAGTAIQIRFFARISGTLLLAGVTASLVVPLLFIVLVWVAAGRWHNPDELQNLLVGLALVAAMPIAGSSTAWSQNGDGDMSLSLGLVLLSTLLSPFLTPIVLESVRLLTVGDYAEDLHELARGGVGAFLLWLILLPSAVGILLRTAARDRWPTWLNQATKPINACAILVLNYANASISLPMVALRPDIDFMVLILVIVVVLCALCFSAGWLLSRLLKAEHAQEVSMTFSLGMSNNGAGLVVASATLADHPAVMLPLIFYTLIQHMFAGLADYLICRPRAEEDATAS
jgi:BASS family bile acid:Na+ symporter